MKEKHGGRDCAFIETNLTTWLDWLRPELNARNCFVIQMIAALPACLVDCTCRHSLCARGVTSADMCHCLARLAGCFYDGNKFHRTLSTLPFNHNSTNSSFVFQITVFVNRLPNNLEYVPYHIPLPEQHCLLIRHTMCLQKRNNVKSFHHVLYSNK